MFEQQFDVAGDAHRKFVGIFVCLVEGSHLERVYAGDRCRHRFGRAAQHIDVGVVCRLVPRRGHGVREHLAGTVLHGIIGFHDVGPQHTACTQFGDFHEVVRGDGLRETDLFGGLFDREAHIHQAYQVVVTGSEREGERLDDRRAGVAEDFARYRDYADTFVGFGFPNQVGDLFETLGTVLRTEAAFRGQFLDQRVDAEIDVHLFRRQLLLFDLRDHQLCHMGGFTAAEGNFDCRDMNILEQRIQIFCGEGLRNDLEFDRIDARIEDLERDGVRLLGAIDDDRLVDLPAVVGAGAPHVGENPGFGAEELQSGEVFSPVVGTDVETFRRFPHQFTLVVRTFEVGLDYLLPLLGRNRRKFGKQLFTFGSCHNKLEISIEICSIAFKLPVKI